MMVAEEVDGIGEERATRVTLPQGEKDEMGLLDTVYPS